MALSGRQKRHLRSEAHHLSVVVQVGKNGLTPAVVASVDEALKSHELIKVRFSGDRDEKRAFADTLAAKLGAEPVGMVGHVGIFYRQAEAEEDRHVKLPS